jgi:hypothetical protein
MEGPISELRPTDETRYCACQRGATHPSGGRRPSGIVLSGSECPERLRLVKSRQRVIDHGEVFSPPWMVNAMLDLVKDESERIDSRFLEPACGSGNFLVPVLTCKLRTVEARYGKSEFERRNYALLSLMCIYGIELLADNAGECRENLLGVFASYLGLGEPDDLYQAAKCVLFVNIVQGDALTMTDANGNGDAIVFPEWGYLGKGRFQRRDFRYDTLTQTSAFGENGTLFAGLGHHEIFEPIRSYPILNVAEIAHG